MRFRTKILLDRTLGTPIAVAVDQVCLLLRKISKSKTASATPRRIVISKIVGIGSAIQFTPALNALKEAFPAVEVIFLTSKGNAEIIQRLPGIDKVLTLDDKSLVSLFTSSLAAISEIRKLEPDVFIDLEVYSSFSSLLGTTFGAPKRIGFYRKSCAFKEGLFTDLIFFNTKVAVWRLYCQLTRVLGVGEMSQDDPPLGPIAVSEHEERAVRIKIASLTGWDLSENYIVINTNASDLLLERRWPEERFIQVIDRLTKSGDTVLLTGSPAEQGHVEKILAQCSDQVRCKSLAGKLSLVEFICALKQARLVLTNDTGPMHIACAVQTPTIALFGPGDYHHYSLPKATSTIIAHPIACGPCLYHSDVPPCRGKNICMEKITVDEVLKSIESAKSGIFTTPDSREKMQFSDEAGLLVGHFQTK